MFQKTVDLAYAIQALRHIVGQFGADHIAGGGNGVSCVYSQRSDDGFALVPVCIVGQFFANEGILRATLRSDGHDSGQSCVLDSTLWRRAEEFGVVVTDEARQFFREAQAVQDDGNPWGAALARALEHTQNKALGEFKRTHPAFTMESPKPLPEEEPLQAWERELLAGE